MNGGSNLFLKKRFFRDVDNWKLRRRLDSWYDKFGSRREDIYRIRYEQLQEGVIFLGVDVPINYCLNGDDEERERVRKENELYVNSLRQAIDKSGFRIRQGKLDARIGGYVYLENER